MQDFIENRGAPVYIKFIIIKIRYDIPFDRLFRKDIFSEIN